MDSFFLSSEVGEARGNFSDLAVIFSEGEFFIHCHAFACISNMYFWSISQGLIRCSFEKAQYLCMLCGHAFIVPRHRSHEKKGINNAQMHFFSHNTQYSQLLQDPQGATKIRKYFQRKETITHTPLFSNATSRIRWERHLWRLGCPTLCLAQKALLSRSKVIRLL